MDPKPGAATTPGLRCGSLLSRALIVPRAFRASMINANLNFAAAVFVYLFSLFR